MFYAAGRHPLAGIAAAFAGVSGGFSANFIPSGIDPLLSGLTQEGAAIVDPEVGVNPLCNWFFMSVSSILIVLVGWFLTDKVIEPRLRGTEIDGDPEQMPQMPELTDAEKRGMWMGIVSIVIGLGLLTAWALPQKSALRDSLGNLTSYRNSERNIGLEFKEGTAEISTITEKGPAAAATLQVGDTIKKIRLPGKGDTDVQTEDAAAQLQKLSPGTPYLIKIDRGGEEIPLIYSPAAIPGAPMMQAIVPIIFLIFILPGLVHGYVSGKFKNHRDVVKGMAKTMETMGYYLVLVFFAALFIKAFTVSNIGTLLAVKGANFIKESGAPVWVTVLGIILLAASVNLLVGSASAKWAMLAPIFVPMLMLAGKPGVSPEFTQAAYRVGDSTTNIITPMMPYFPLVVVFCQRYVKKTGIGTVTAMMLPFSITFLIIWSIFLILYWKLGLPLGLDAPYTYSVPGS